MRAILFDRVGVQAGVLRPAHLPTGPSSIREFVCVTATTKSPAMNNHNAHTSLAIEGAQRFGQHLHQTLALLQRESGQCIEWPRFFRHISVIGAGRFCLPSAEGRKQLFQRMQMEGLCETGIEQTDQGKHPLPRTRLAQFGPIAIKQRLAYSR